MTVNIKDNSSKKDIWLHVGRKNFALFSLLLMAIIVCIFHIVDFTSELGTDYNVYFSQGWFISRGLVPYIDFWTHKTPLLPMVLAVWVSLVGHSLNSAVLFEIVVTVIASYSVFIFVSVMRLPSGVRLLSSAFFAFFASLHGLDPTRNGIVTIFASIFECLSFATLIIGLREESRGHLYLSGLLFFLAFASRQTSAPVYLAMILVIWFFDRAKDVRVRIYNYLLVFTGALVCLTLFVVYFHFEGISADTLLNQLYSFNVLYARSFSSTDIFRWFLAWGSIVARASGGSAYFFAIGILVYLLGTCATIFKQREIKDFTTVLLLSMLFVHLAALLLAQKRMGFYLYQIFPEGSIIAGILVWNVVTRRDLYGSPQPTSSKWNGFLHTYLTRLLIAVMLLVPLAYEIHYSYMQINAAKNGDYLFNVTNLPDNKVARAVRGIAANPNSRIWVFGMRESLYPFSDRLPALTYADSVPLEHALYSDEQVYKIWEDQFMSKRPVVVVNYFTEEKLLENHEEGPWSSRNLWRIREFIVSNMCRINSLEFEYPEIYVWNDGLP